MRSVTAHHTSPTDATGRSDKSWELGMTGMLTYACRLAARRYRPGCCRRRWRRIQRSVDSALRGTVPRVADRRFSRSGELLALVQRRGGEFCLPDPPLAFPSRWDLVMRASASYFPFLALPGLGCLAPVFLP